MRKRRLPQPEKFTLKDGLQIMLGLIMVPLGALILGRAWLAGAPVLALLIGGAFIGFGVYRTLFAWGRVRWYRKAREASKNG